MDFSRKLIILLITIIFIYIIVRLIIKRIQIKQQIEGYENETTHTIQSENNCPLTIGNNLKPKLLNIKKQYSNEEALSLKNYSIKASLKSTFNGKENNTDMIHYILSRGCRFLDFEVYVHTDSQTENTSIVVSTCKNNDSDFLPLDANLSISDVMYYVNMYAFNSLCPNYDDPLFIQLRPKIRNDANYNNSKASICSSINDAIRSNLTPVYNGIVTNNTSMLDLLGKIVIVMDHIEFSDCISNINLPSKKVDVMNTYSYQNMPQEKILKIKQEYICDVTTINQVVFEDVSGVSYNTNVSTDYLFKNYSIQIMPMMFWNSGGDLCNYETLYNKCGGGIVPLYLIYIQLSKGTSKYIQYPEPLFASSVYGSQTATLFVMVACLAVVGFIVVKELS